MTLYFKSIINFEINMLLTLFSIIDIDICLIKQKKLDLL